MVRRRIYYILLLVLAVSQNTAGAALPPQASGIVTVAPAVLPLSAPELVNPLRGLYRWYNEEVIPQPRPSYDHYVRYSWREIEPAKNVYDFSVIERDMAQAQRAGAKFAFRIMSINEFNDPIEVPAYLKQEAGGAFCDYHGLPIWVPAWDSPAFVGRAAALLQALGARFDGDPRLAYYDMGIYGHWGEWHSLDLCTPPASAATKRALVDMQVNAFPTTRVLMNSGADEVDAFLYALSKSPRIGVRVDSLCNTAFDYQFNLSPAKQAIMKERWKTAPIVTEFFEPNPTDIDLCLRQVHTWHVASVANSRVNWSVYSASKQQQFLLLGKQSGYRFAINTVAYPQAAAQDIEFAMRSQWSNQGVTPAYEPVQVLFQLRRQGQPAVVWQQASKLDLQRLLPTAQPELVADRLMIPSQVPAGDYILSIKVVDPSGYRAPMLLANTGVAGDGSYVIGKISVVRATAKRPSIFLPMVKR